MSLPSLPVHQPPPGERLAQPVGEGASPDPKLGREIGRADLFIDRDGADGLAHHWRQPFTDDGVEDRCEQNAGCGVVLEQRNDLSRSGSWALTLIKQRHRLDRRQELAEISPHAHGRGGNDCRQRIGEGHDDAVFSSQGEPLLKGEKRGPIKTSRRPSDPPGLCLHDLSGLLSVIAERQLQVPGPQLRSQRPGGRRDEPRRARLDDVAGLETTSVRVPLDDVVEHAVVFRERTNGRGGGAVVRNRIRLRDDQITVRCSNCLMCR
jgi:hypothetical protein